MTRFFSEALTQHDRSSFSSGNERIDAYFRHTVSQDIKRKYAGCYLLIERASSRIAGFYTLSAYTIALTEVADEVAKKLPRYPSIPAVLIGWMGRDQGFRGQGVGSLLLSDALARLATSPIGAHALCADALDDDALAFYERHQFTRFKSRPMSLYLPIKTAQALIAGQP